MSKHLRTNRRKQLRKMLVTNTKQKMVKVPIIRLSKVSDDLCPCGSGQPFQICACELPPPTSESIPILAKKKL